MADLDVGHGIEIDHEGLPRGAVTRRAAVLGSPVAHSLSPSLHAAAYSELGLTGWFYDRVEVSEAGLAAFVEGLGDEWAGLSLTMPLKQAVLPLLDSISPLAAAVGAVNTVTFEPSDTAGRSRRRGDNTDVGGIVGALGEAGVSRLRPGDGTGVVLGGGATAASAVAALAELGCREPVVVVRSSARAGVVLAAAERLDVRPRLVRWDDAPVGEQLQRADVVVSTVPSGAADQLAQTLQEQAAVGARWPGVLLDVVYDPWPTALASAWVAGGGVAVDGLAMLVHQAAAQVLLWTGEAPSIEGLRAAVNNLR